MIKINVLVLVKILPEKKTNDGKTFYTTYIFKDIDSKEYALHLRRDFTLDVRSKLVINSIWKDIEVETFNSSKINSLKFTSFNQESFCGNINPIELLFDSLSLQTYIVNEKSYIINITQTQLIIVDFGRKTSKKITKERLLIDYQIHLK